MTTQSIPVSPQLKALVSCQVKAKVLIMTCVTPCDATLLPRCPSLTLLPYVLGTLLPQALYTASSLCLDAFPPGYPHGLPSHFLDIFKYHFYRRLFLTIPFRTTAYPPHSSPGTPPPFYIIMLYFSPIMSKLFLLMYLYWVKKTLPIMIYPCPNPWYLHI